MVTVQTCGHTTPSGGTDIPVRAGPTDPNPFTPNPNGYSKPRCAMTDARMKIIFNLRDDWPPDDAGIPAADLSATVRCLQNATLLTAAHLAGMDSPHPLPEWLRRQCALRMLSISDDGKEATFGLPPFDAAPGVANYGAAALEAVLNWSGPNDPNLPRPVSRQLDAIRNTLSPDVTGIRLCNLATGLRMSIGRSIDFDANTPAARALPGAADSKPEEVSLFGRIRAINWENGTARMQPFLEPPVVLHFDASLNATMQQFATHLVTVRGVGHLDADGWRGPVKVHEIHSNSASALEKLNAKEPKIFDPERATSYYQHDDDDPIDIEEFIRVIYEARGS